MEAGCGGRGFCGNQGKEPHCPAAAKTACSSSSSQASTANTACATTSATAAAPHPATTPFTATCCNSSYPTAHSCSAPTTINHPPKAAANRAASYPTSSTNSRSHPAACPDGAANPACKADRLAAAPEKIIPFVAFRQKTCPTLSSSTTTAFPITTPNHATAPSSKSPNHPPIHPTAASTQSSWPACLHSPAASCQGTATITSSGAAAASPNNPSNRRAAACKAPQRDKEIPSHNRNSSSLGSRGSSVLLLRACPRKRARAANAASSGRGAAECSSTKQNADGCRAA